MNRGIWLFLEVVFDTLMFAPYLLRGHFRHASKGTDPPDLPAAERQAAAGPSIQTD